MASLLLKSPPLFLKDGINRLHLAFTASAKLSVPHTGWQKRTLWNGLTVLAPPSGFLICMKLLWKHEAVPEEWYHIFEGFGRAMANGKFWEQLSLQPNLELHSNEEVHLNLHSTVQIPSPPTALPCSRLLLVSMTLDYRPYAIKTDVDRRPQLKDLMVLADAAVLSYLNDTLGKEGVAGGIFLPNYTEQLVRRAAFAESIASSVAQVAVRARTGVIEEQSSLKKRLKHLSSYPLTSSIDGIFSPCSQRYSQKQILDARLYHLSAKASQFNLKRCKLLNIYDDESLAQLQLSQAMCPDRESQQIIDRALGDFSILQTQNRQIDEAMLLSSDHEELYSFNFAVSDEGYSKPGDPFGFRDQGEFDDFIQFEDITLQVPFFANNPEEASHGLLRSHPNLQLRHRSFPEANTWDSRRWTSTRGQPASPAAKTFPDHPILGHGLELDLFDGCDQEILPNEPMWNPMHNSLLLLDNNVQNGICKKFQALSKPIFADDTDLKHLNRHVSVRDTRSRLEDQYRILYLVEEELQLANKDKIACHDVDMCMGEKYISMKHLDESNSYKNGPDQLTSELTEADLSMQCNGSDTYQMLFD